MKLFYCHIPGGNFGDELNTFLWPRLLPDAFDGTVRFEPKSRERFPQAKPDDSLFVGIGTLIRSDLPSGATKHIFGSGFGYGEVPRMDAKWNLHCVRGPLTAEALGLDPEKAITDPAILVRLLPRGTARKIYSHSFIPHWEMAVSGDWERVCRLVGVHYIDPRWPPARVLRDIHKTRTLVTEALHGAIVADALRVPWIAVSSLHTILKFKWEDWCRSVGVDYSPARVPTFWKPRPGMVGNLINGAKEMQAALALSYLTRWGAPVLSGERTMDRLTDRLLSALDALCRSHRLTLNASPGLESTTPGDQDVGAGVILRAG
jgi:succinoglycan biosynthesis protein ExoV